MATIILKNVRLSYADLFKPKEFKGKMRYGANLLVEPGSENEKLIRAEMKKVALDKWGKKAEALLKANEGNAHKSCYLDGNTRDVEGYEGVMYLASYRAASQGAPKVVNRDKSPIGPDEGIPYAGCYVNAKVDIYAQTGDNLGMRAGLVAIQFVRDGEAFGGGAPATDEGFDDISDGDMGDDENDMWDAKSA